MYLVISFLLNSNYPSLVMPKEKTAGSRSDSESIESTSEKSDRSKDRDSNRGSRSRSQSVASNNENQAGDDLQSREARLKAKLKEKFLKEQLDKKFKDLPSNNADKKASLIKNHEKTPESQNRSRSSSVTNERSVNSSREASNDENSPKSFKRTRNTDESSQSNETEKFGSKYESNRIDDTSGSDDESHRRKKTDDHEKQRRVNFYLCLDICTQKTQRFKFRIR